jgi:hypothetical protein
VEHPVWGASVSLWSWFKGILNQGARFR